MNNGNSYPDLGTSLGANLRNCHLKKYLKVKFVRMANCLDMSDRIGEVGHKDAPAFSRETISCNDLYMISTLEDIYIYYWV